MLGACAPVRCKDVAVWCTQHSKNRESEFEDGDFLSEQRMAEKQGVVKVMKAVIKEKG